MSDERTLFTRDAEDPADHDEIWDDSALIDAYDRALESARRELGLTSVGGGAKPRVPASRRQRQQRSAPPPAWRIGDFCIAEYSEDGIEYEGVVRAVDKDSGTCTVEFVGYGNTEDVDLDALKPSAGKKARKRQTEQAAEDQAREEAAAESTTAGPATGDYTTSSSQRPPTTSLPYYPTDGLTWPSGWGFQPPWTPASYSPWTAGPRIPPPPPPPAAGEDLEALANMLMSWYISGYNTGYYQGLNDGRARRPGGR